MAIACPEREIYGLIQLVPNFEGAMNPRYLELNDTVFDTVELR